MPSPRAGASGSSGSGGGGGPAMTARLPCTSCRSRTTFQEIVDSLPSDWTDLELDLRVDESRYIDAASCSCRSTRSPTRTTTGTGGSSSRTSSATPRRRRPCTARSGCSTSRHPRRAGPARAAHGPRRDGADVGPRRVRAPGVPPHALAVVARVVAVFDDLLLGSNVLGLLRAAGHEAQLAGPHAARRRRGRGRSSTSAAPASTASPWRPRFAAARRRSASTRTCTTDVKLRAEAAGFDLVVPRSRMAREGPALVERVLARP